MLFLKAFADHKILKQNIEIKRPNCFGRLRKVVRSLFQCFILISVEFRKLQTLVLVQRPFDVPFAGEDEQVVALYVLDKLCV